FYNDEEDTVEQPPMPPKPRRRPKNETEEQAQHGGEWYLQEDGDPSHGMRRKGLAQQLKEANWIDNLKHPA
ncbi:hypothetical protein DL95DRAFT_274595, partial [Leptodontidium sp. 2 PMI_412]